MLNLKIYTAKELQNFLSMLNQCENNNVTDIRFVREQIDRYIHDTLLNHRIKDIRSRRKLNHSRLKRKDNVRSVEKFKLCPSCGKARLFPVKNNDGLNIVGCSKCRYSEIVKEN